MTELQTDVTIGGEPNNFVLHSEDAQVSFSESGFTGEPRLHYRDSDRELDASGEEIRQVKTELGKLVTITLAPERDGGKLLFTLLVPRALVSSATKSVGISTQGIITHSLTLRMATSSGTQLQTYRIMQLEGAGQLVDT